MAKLGEAHIRNFRLEETPDEDVTLITFTVAVTGETTLDAAVKAARRCIAGEERGLNAKQKPDKTR